VNHWHLRQAARIIHNGGVIAYPTEAVYGLGCDPLNAKAVLHLLALKRRSIDKGLVLIASDRDQLKPFIAPLDSNQIDTLDASWPGPVTWLVPANPNTPQWLKGNHNTIAVRVTAHSLAAALCRELGHALVSTSANLSGTRPARNPLQVHRYFDQQLDGILNGPLGKLAKPTPIQDLCTGRIVRSG
jgi:L-threonylcarbamoyladenylate synthase